MNDMLAIELACYNGESLDTCCSTAYIGSRDYGSILKSQQVSLDATASIGKPTVRKSMGISLPHAFSPRYELDLTSDLENLFSNYSPLA